jgi:hypothetical protein
MTINTQRFWRALTLVVRIDMAVGICLAAALLIWTAWH